MRHRHWTLGMIAVLMVLVGGAVGLAVRSGDAVQAQAPEPQAAEAAVGTAFTYQGQLTDDRGDPLTGPYDFRFELYDGSGSGAAQIGGAVTVDDQPVDDGLFRIELDFGSGAFDGGARWLDIAVREGGSTDSYTPLAPRQTLTPAPYALGFAPGSAVSGTVNNGGILSLENSADDGLRIESAGGDGVEVASAGYGFYADTVSMHGFSVSYAGYDGLHVGAAADDGLQVGSADYGIYVASAREDGIFVDDADSDGDGFGIAAYLNGDVRATGYLTAANLAVTGSKHFVIDHPQDPENRYLYHSSVESPERMNVYNGNVTTDGEGYATVILPDYFEALNRDYRYQLTVIGTFAQAIVAEEIENNRFVIRTDAPHVKVSWQVTGVRQDPAAEADPMEVEIEKPEDKKGRYLNPEAYGQPASQRITADGRSEKAEADDR